MLFGNAPELSPFELICCNCSKNMSTAFVNTVIGAAVFDLNGLPKQYYTTVDNQDVSWVQTIFQAVGLRSLLGSSLQLEGFRYAVVCSDEHQAVVVRQKSCYVALLLRNSPEEPLSEAFKEWLLEFDLQDLTEDTRFNSI